MNDKAALELSVNVIVILIIALVVLGLIIGFVVSKFRQADRFKIDEPTPEPDSYSPIQTPGGRDSFSFNKKSQVEMEVRFYNMNTKGFDSFWTNATQIECVGEGGTYYLSPELPATSIGPGEEGYIPLLFTVDVSMPVGVYACQLVFRSESYYSVLNGIPNFQRGDTIAERYMEIEVT